MKPIEYGSIEWLMRAKLRGAEPIGKIGRIVVLRYGNMLCKAVGGTPDAPTVVALEPREVDQVKPFPGVDLTQVFKMIGPKSELTRTPVEQKKEPHDPFKGRLTPHAEIVKRRGASILVVRNLLVRGDQELTAYLRSGIVGTWKTSTIVLIEPTVMKPSAVAMCEEYVSLAVFIPMDRSIVSVRFRGDAYGRKEPPPWEEIRPKGKEFPIVGAETTGPLWRTWYNETAKPEEQEVFDRITKVIDDGGADYLPGGPEANWIERYRYTQAPLYPALVNYRDTGGRRALVTTYTTNYGDKPIAVIKAGGPIEKKADGSIVLHPGRYSYSDMLLKPGESVTSSNSIPAKESTFRRWLDQAISARNAQILRTQASLQPSVFAMIYADLGVESGDEKPIYIDYEFLVAKDLVWNTTIKGLPTWLPKSATLENYWGKPTPHSKLTEELKRVADEAAKAIGEGLSALTTLGALAGIGYVLFLISQRGRSYQRA